MLCRSDQSQHPNTTLLQRSDISVVPLREISLEAIQRYDERHEISPRPHFLELWLRHRAGDVFVARDSQGHATATCAFGLAYSPSVKVGGWGPGWQKIPSWHRCC